MLYSFARWNGNDRLIVVNNFSPSQTHSFSLKIPEQLIQQWQLKDGVFEMTDELTGKKDYKLEIKNGFGNIEIILSPLQSLLLAF